MEYLDEQGQWGESPGMGGGLMLRETVAGCEWAKTVAAGAGVF
jgi:hypothetical protein